MTAQNTKGGRQPSATARAEAAAWVARLHGPNRTQEVEAGLRRWLADDPEHAEAFEVLTDTWEKSARLRRRPVEEVASWERRGLRISFARAAVATAAVATVAILSTLYYLRSDVIATGVGELRTMTLEDGTRVHMNTSTRVVVRYDKSLRQVRLESGEALFEVAKRPDWPFVVTAGARQIRALGTEFDVRRDAHNVVVTLVEGKVTVTPAEMLGAAAIDSRAAAARERRGNHQVTASQPTGSGPEVETITLSPGDRLTFNESGSAHVDRPPLERVTAWEHGQVILDNTSLADAVAEMNRYSRQRIVINDPAVAAIRVSGIFEAGDSVNFAEAVGRTYRLRVREQASEAIVLTAADNDPGAQEAK